MERKFVLGAVVVGVVGFVAATSLKRNDELAEVGASAADPVTTRIERASASTSTTIIEKAGRSPSSGIEERRDDALFAHVEHKYRYLLADVESAHVEELKRRLLDRESEEDLARKAATDVRVGEMLSPREREYYQALKDSDLEQRKVAEYVGGVGNVAPLEGSQERQILDAKLRQKQRSAATLRDVGVDRDMLSEAERQYAQAQVAEVLKGYLDDFLLEVSPSLTQEQYTLLRNYETTEFQRELERLQRQINSK